MIDKKCKHNAGWCCIDSELVFLSPSKGIQIGRNTRFGHKIKTTCNIGCGATRNIYIKAKISRLGKIKEALKEAENDG